MEERAQGEETVRFYRCDDCVFHSCTVCAEVSGRSRRKARKRPEHAGSAAVKDGECMMCWEEAKEMVRLCDHGCLLCKGCAAKAPAKCPGCNADLPTRCGRGA